MAETESDLKDPGLESLIFKPAKVSWAINAFLAKQSNRGQKSFVYSVLAIVGGLVTWGYLSDHAIVIDSVGEIISKSPPIPVSASSTLTVKEILVKNNQTVKKDDVLVISTRNVGSDVEKQIDGSLSTLEKNIALDKRGACSQPCREHLQMVAGSSFPWLSKLDTSTEFYRNIGSLSKGLKDYVTQMGNLIALPTTTENLEFQIKSTRQKMDEIRRRNAQKILAVEYEDLQNKLLNFQGQVREKKLSAESSLTNSRNMVEVSLQQAVQTFSDYSSDSVIRAPLDGAIAFQELKGQGQIVGAGQIMMYVHSKNSELGVKLKLPEAEIAKVRKGMEVKLDISSYPASDYGVQSAEISEIPEKLDINDQKKDNNFDIYANLKTQGVQYRGQTLYMRSGVSLSAKIIVKHEKMIIFVWKKLLSIKDEYVYKSDNL